MQLVMSKGITVTIDDDVVDRWAYELDPFSDGKDYYIWLKDGSKWCYMSATKEFFLFG